MPNKKVLLIEDERVLVKALEVELEDCGIDVLVANDGKKGLELAKKEKPGFILLDLILPKMQGLEVLDELKKDSKTKEIPVLILSNLSPEVNGERDPRKKYGVVDYIVKADVDLQKLVEKIKKYL